MKHFQITADQLAKDGACRSSVDKVRDLFGDGPIKMTRCNLRIALDNSLEVYWLSRYLSDQSWEACEAQCAQLWEACEAQCAQAREAYKAQCADILYKLLNG